MRRDCAGVRMQRRAGPNAGRGFTLLEILIGLVLLSVMMTLLFGSIRMGARIWDAGETRAAELDRMLIVQNFLRYHLSTLRPVIDDLSGDGDVKFSFSGTEHSIQFVSDLPSSARRKGLHQFNLEVVEGEDRSGVLVAKLKAFYPALDGVDAAIEDVRLLSGVESMVLSYFGADRFNIKAPAGQWMDQWEDKEFMPFLIKIDIRMRSGHRFNSNRIIEMLRNEKYAGDVVFGKELNKRKRPIDLKLEAITVKDAHEAIVPREDWERVQAMLDGKRRDVRHPRTSPSDYLFSTLIECGLCNAKMVGRSAWGKMKKRFRYYTCDTLNRYGHFCVQKKFNAYDLEAAVIKKLRDRLTSKESLKKMVATYNDSVKAVKETTRHEMPRIEKELVKIERKQTRLFEAIENSSGALTHSDVASRLRELAAKKTELEIQAVNLRAKANLKTVSVADQTITDWLDMMESLFRDPDYWNRKNHMQSGIESIVVGKDTITVAYDANFLNEKHSIKLPLPHMPPAKKDANNANSERLAGCSHEAIVVDRRGIEPLTSTMPLWRSPS